jgi:voltage-gated potassium channel
MNSSRSAADRVHIAEEVERRLDPVMGMLGIIFALVVVAEAFVRPQGAVGTAVTVASWGLWAVFVIEFASRMAIAPSKSRFLKKNWWQAIFLAFPFLRLLRVLRVARLARAGRLVSSSLRAGRSAARALTGRIGWLVGFTVVVVLSTAQGLFEFGGYDSYADALFDAAMASITGQGVQGDSAVSRVLSIVLALYSVAVFASLAAALGAYFMRPDEVDNPQDEVVG